VKEEKRREGSTYSERNRRLFWRRKYEGQFDDHSENILNDTIF